MATLVDWKPASVVLSQEEEEASAANGSSEQKKQVLITALAAHVDKKWELARSSKRTVEDQFLENLRARRRRYPPEMIAALQQMFGPEYKPIFAPIIETKCSAVRELDQGNLLFRKAKGRGI